MTFVTIILCVAFVALIAALGRYPLSLKALYIYCLGYASIVAFGYDHHPAIPFLKDKFDVYSMLGASHVVGFLLFAYIIVMFHKAWGELIWKASLNGMRAFLTFDALWILAGKSSLLTGDTFDGAILAMFFPLLFLSKNVSKVRYATCFVWLLAIYAHGGSTAWLILVAQALAYGITSRTPRFIALSAIFILLGWFTQGTAFLKSDGRLLMWAQYIDWWTANANVWIGTGPGTFEWIGPMIPLSHTKYNFYWMHNDFIQFGFEYGLIGLALMLAANFYFLRFIWRSPLNVATWVGVLICMFFYSPIHLAPVALMLALMIARPYGDA